MVRTIFAVMLIALFAASASAYDFLYSGDTAMTHDAGSFGVKGTFLYMMANSYYDADGEKQDYEDDGSFTGMWIPIDIYYSIMDQLELGVQAKFLSNKYTWSSESRGDEEATGSGLGDTWVWVKYMFMPEPMFTARVGAKIATGEDEPDEGDIPTGEGQMDIDGAIMFGMPAGPGQFDAAVGYRYRMSREVEYTIRETYDYKPGNEIHFYAAYTYFLNDAMNLRLGADGYFGSDDEVDWGTTSRDFETVDDSASNAVYVNPGFDYMMENGVAFGADFHYPLMGTNVEADWGFGICVGWGM